MNPDPPFAAFIGIDWADERHDLCLLPSQGGRAERETLQQQPEAIAAWASSLRVRFDGSPIAVCLEQTRGALAFSLLQFEFLVLFPINPSQLAAYRRALHPSGAKDDLTDAELLARFLREHHAQLRAWRPDDQATRALRLLTEQRRDWVERRVALENELRQRLKETYPLALTLLGGGSLSGAVFLDLLERFPTQRELRRASPKQLERWLPRARRRADDPPADELLREKIARLRQALPLTRDAAILEHARLVIRHIVPMIRAIQKAIAECDEKIAARLAEHPDRDLFMSFPGAGAALVPRLIAAFGADRERFASAQEVQSISGIAPVTRASGKTKVVMARWACPKFLRQTFHELAHHSVRFSRWAQAYVAMRRAAGVDYQVIIRGLAFKWQRILFRCWQNRQPYDEDQYLQRLRAANSPLLSFLPQTSPSP